MNWEANTPAELKEVLATLKEVHEDFNDDLSGDKYVSLADVIVLGGAAAIEKAASDAGYDVTVPFEPFFLWFLPIPALIVSCKASAGFMSSDSTQSFGTMIM